MHQPKFELNRLLQEEDRLPFDCGDADLNEFFSVDSAHCCGQLLSVTYTVSIDDNLAAFFSVSNDAIKSEDTSNTQFKKLKKLFPWSKRYNSMPAVKIGRLGVAANYQSTGVGTQVIDFLKAWFTVNNKTGCRFIIVDAYNNEKTLRFYSRNGFDFLNPGDSKDDTRLMYFDLMTFINTANDSDTDSEQSGEKAA